MTDWGLALTRCYADSSLGSSKHQRKTLERLFHQRQKILFAQGTVVPQLKGTYDTENQGCSNHYRSQNPCAYYPCRDQNKSQNHSERKEVK